MRVKVYYKNRCEEIRLTDTRPAFLKTLFSFWLRDGVTRIEFEDGRVFIRIQNMFKEVKKHVVSKDRESDSKEGN